MLFSLLHFFTIANFQKRQKLLAKVHSFTVMVFEPLCIVYSRHCLEYFNVIRSHGIMRLLMENMPKKRVYKPSALY